MDLLEIKNLTKYYKPSVPALRDVCITAGKGEFISVIGPSGAGKSTLLRCINRMIEPSSGSVNFDGIDVLKAGKHELRRVRTQIGMIFQHYNLVDRLTVIENVLHGRLGHKSFLPGVLGIYVDHEKKQAVQIIEILGLKEQIYQRCDCLSGGQKQRVGIGRALVQNPKLILCDEPISSLDPLAATTIMEYLKNICQQMQITVIVNLHQVSYALKYSDRIIGIKQGEVVFDGSPQALVLEKIKCIYDSEAGDFDITWGEKYAG